MNTKIINILSNHQNESRKIAFLLTESLTKHGFRVQTTYSEQAELNICIGGDGAFIHAIHQHDFPNIPFVGINTGHLGFFQEIQPENIDFFLQNYLLKKYYIEELSLVEAKIRTDKNTFSLLGINEIVIKGSRSKVIHLEIFIDGNHLENFSGDGVIISTPAGSTAYNFSAGGSIVHPSLKTMQLNPLAPISSSAYRSLLHSAVIPGDTPITVKPERDFSNSITIVVDGTEHIYERLRQIDTLISKRTVKKLTFFKESYWNNLKHKFL